MGEKEDKEKAEKLAAAKKRVAQLQKKKKAAGSGGDKAGVGSSSKKVKDDLKSSEKEEADDTPLSPTKIDPEENDSVEQTTQVVEEGTFAEKDPDEAAFDEVIKSARDQALKNENNAPDENEDATISPPSGESASIKPHRPGRQPSVSIQSKLRSASFRQGATPTSPAADDEFPDIYRKQMTRIDELERENRRLAQEAEDSQARWRKNEAELEVLRERNIDQDDGDATSDEVQQLRSEIDQLRRNSRPSFSASKSKPSEDLLALQKELENKEATISDMQLEISRLRSQVTSLTEGGSDENEQIAALQDSLQRAEASNTKLQTELADVKKSLRRASEKAVSDGTEQTSKDIKIKSLEREIEAVRVSTTAVEQKRDTLEKKVEAMNKLHREAEQRNAPKLSQLEAALKDLTLLKAKLEAAEKDNLRLREARKHRMSGDGAEEGLDELEDEDRQRLEKHIRDLESENFDLRRGVWRDKRRDLQPNLSRDKEIDAFDETDGFDEVDLNGSGANTRKGSTIHPPPMQAKHSGFTQIFNSGLAAFRASTTSPDSQLHQQHTGRPRNDSLLEELDDEAFDENAFAQAQREEEMRKMVEHVREVKKGLKQWQGWRLDLVDLRRSSAGGAGFGEIFDV